MYTLKPSSWKNLLGLFVGIAVPSGMKTNSHNPTSRHTLLKAVKESILVADRNNMKVKFIYHDGEKSSAGDSLGFENCEMMYKKDKCRHLLVTDSGCSQTNVT